MKNQFISLLLTLATAIFLLALFYEVILLLNLLPLSGKIFLKLLPFDILVGLTIYLKTSIDFAIFIGNLMTKFQSFRQMVAIEIGTSLGNGLGTIFVLIIWIVFKEIPLLLFCMVLLASLVLITFAQESAKDYASSLT